MIVAITHLGSVDTDGLLYAGYVGEAEPGEQTRPLRLVYKDRTVILAASVGRAEDITNALGVLGAT